MQSELIPNSHYWKQLKTALHSVFVDHDERSCINHLLDMENTYGTSDVLKIWISYVELEFLLSEEATKDAINRLETISAENREYLAASYYLLACAWRSIRTSKQSPVINNREIEYIEKSIVTAPEWVANHEQLGMYMEKMGNKRSACEEYKRAMGNITKNIDLVELEKSWSTQDLEFNMYISGVWTSRPQRFEVQIERLEKELLTGTH